MTEVATVYLIDDDAAVRDSLRFLLQKDGFRSHAYDSAEAFLGSTPSQHGCVLTDLRMPGIDGLDLQSRLSERHSLLPVIVMTGQADVKLAVRAMKAGAVDFLEKPFNETQLLDAIRRALAANEQALAAAAEAGEAANRLAVLTRREREVLDLLVTGKSTKEIANIIGGSPRTIDVHRARVFGKLGAASLPDLVELMRRAHSAGPP